MSQEPQKVTPEVVWEAMGTTPSNPTPGTEYISAETGVKFRYDGTHWWQIPAEETPVPQCVTCHGQDPANPDAVSDTLAWARKTLGYPWLHPETGKNLEALATALERHHQQAG